MCVSDWRVNKKRKMEAEVRSWGACKSIWEQKQASSLRRPRQNMQCSGHRQHFPNYTDPRPVPKWFYQLCSSSSQLQLGCSQATIKVVQIPILVAWSFSHWALRASPTGKCCWRKYFGDMEIKQDTALGRQAAFYKGGTRQQRAGTLVGKACNRGGRRHRNTLHLDSAAIIS